jgi:purine-binding chemotaxis protein CheW
MGTEKLGLPSDVVTEIMEVPPITPLPNTAAHLLGVIKVKGITIPIIDLKKKLLDVFTQITDSCRIIVIDINYSQVGLLVEALPAKLSYEFTELLPLENLDSEVPADYLVGIMTVDNNIIKVLNCEALPG